MLVPLLLAIAGVALIIAGQLNLDQSGVAGPSLPNIPEPTATPIPTPSPTVTVAGTPTASASPTPSPTPNPSWVAVQLQIPSVGINVRVKKATGSQCDFPPLDGAYILCGGNEPGRGTNSYIFAHARTGLFLALWNVMIGAEIRVRMSDGQVLVYRVTEIHPNVSCPDTREPPMTYWGVTPPPALRYAAPGCPDGAFWQAATDYERLTLQTSQGYNRNWGEFIVVALPER
jgi:Sortase domain